MAVNVQVPATLAPSGAVESRGRHGDTDAASGDTQLSGGGLAGGVAVSQSHTTAHHRSMKTGKTQEEIRVGWIAVKSQYFTMVVSPTTNVTAVTYASVDVTSPAPVVRGVTAAADVPLTRGANGSVSCAFTWYAGPKDYNRLAALGKHQEELMDFGTPMDFYSGLFGIMLLHSLNFFYRLIPNYGVAIILVTIA